MYYKYIIFEHLHQSSICRIVTVYYCNGIIFFLVVFLSPFFVKALFMCSFFPFDNAYHHHCNFCLLLFFVCYSLKSNFFKKAQTDLMPYFSFLLQKYTFPFYVALSAPVNVGHNSSVCSSMVSLERKKVYILYIRLYYTCITDNTYVLLRL